MLKKESVELKDYPSLSCTSPKPSKIGIQGNTTKIIKKSTKNRLDIIQKTNKGYIHYLLEKNNGKNETERDYGRNHELLRLIGARHIQDVYVYYDISNPTTGSFSGMQFAPSIYSEVESFLTHLPQRNDKRSLSSKDDHLGLAAYKLAPSSEVTYTMNMTKSKQGNLLLLCTATGTQALQIFVNDILIKSINPRALANNKSSYSVAVIDFGIPSLVNSSAKYTIKIRNDSFNGNAFLSSLNYFELKNYNYEEITDWKAFGSKKLGWIENPGASEYALFDADAGKWFGSYHGGEISEYNVINWTKNTMNKRSEYDITFTAFTSIPSGEWRILPFFEIQQRTMLADKRAIMSSIFNFNIDGTIEMDFGYSEGNVNLKIFYTSLVCTETNFNLLLHPIFKDFGKLPSNKFYSFPLNEGKLIQTNLKDSLQLNIRFTKFNEEHNMRGGAAIADNRAYRKFYYGPILNPKYVEKIKLKNLDFSTGLDFIVR